MAPLRNSSEFRIVLKILCFRLSNKSFNESRLSYHEFHNFQISSRTKHESFDSFGSHAQFFILYFMGIPVSFFNVMSLSSLFLFVFKHIKTDTRPEY